MQRVATSALARWTGGMILEYCPWEATSCEASSCWVAALCRTARRKQVLSAWQALAVERRREAFVWIGLAVASAAMLFFAFAWPNWR